MGKQIRNLRVKRADDTRSQYIHTHTYTYALVCGCDGGIDAMRLAPAPE